MNYKYKASIIIPTYNRSKLLNLSLVSILNQSVSKEIFEVIVIDDGSEDNTRDVCKEFSDRLNIKYFYQEHKGFRAATARNTGIKNSEGEVCIFLDSGVLLAKNAIQEQLKSHSSDEEYAFLGYMYGFDEHNENNETMLKMNINPDDVDTYIDILERDRIYDLREKQYQKLGDDLGKWPAPWTIFWTGYLSVKRDVLVKVGMFDEKFNSWGMEDIDLGIALYVNNVKITLNRNLKSIHYPHEKFRPSMKESELKALLLEKKKYINQKYNLESTKLYITNNWSEINPLLL